MSFFLNPDSQGQIPDPDTFRRPRQSSWEAAIHFFSADVLSFMHDNYWCYPLSATIQPSSLLKYYFLFICFIPKMTAMYSINSMEISIVLIIGCHSDNSLSWSFNLLNCYRRDLKKSALFSPSPWALSERCLSILYVKAPRSSTHLITLFGAKCLFK